MTKAEEILRATIGELVWQNALLQAELVTTREIVATLQANIEKSADNKKEKPNV